MRLEQTGSQVATKPSLMHQERADGLPLKEIQVGSGILLWWLLWLYWGRHLALMLSHGQQAG
jgi:hypothetical protein